MTRIRTHVNPLSITHRFDHLDLKTIVSNSITDLAFEVGFGRGVFLKQWAKLNSNSFLIGVEVRKSIVNDVKLKLEKENLNNVSLHHGNAELFLADAVEDESLNHIFVFHPDPWFKKRHHKRRVVNPDFLSLVEKKLKINGKLYVSTDVESLWEAMIETISNTSLKPVNNDPFWTTVYDTHWTTFSVKDERQMFFKSFQKG
tara:strand:+ start:313 stop:915 length:603 start_codon:yes stop_codon:yes gene_type:complete